MNISNLIGYGLGYDGFVLMVQTIVKNGGNTIRVIEYNNFFRDWRIDRIYNSGLP